MLEWFAADAGVRGVLDLGCFLLLCSSPGVPNLGLDFLGAPSGIYPPLGSAVRPLQVQSRPSFSAWLLHLCCLASCGFKPSQVVESSSAMSNELVAQLGALSKTGCKERWWISLRPWLIYYQVRSSSASSYFEGPWASRRTPKGT